MKNKLFIILVLIAALAISLTAHAAGTTAAEPKTKHLRFDSLTVQGEASKPQVFYLLNRKKILIRHRPEEKDLIRSLENSVKGEPF